MASNKHTLGPMEPTLPCLEPSCNRRFFNRSGRSNHMNSQHPQFVHDVQHANLHIASSRMSSPSPDRHGEDHSHDGHNSNDDHDDHDHTGTGNRDSTDHLPDLELPVNDIPFDDWEYQPEQLNDGNQSPLAEPSNAGSYDQVHDPSPPPSQADLETTSVNRTYHPIINGGSESFFTVNFTIDILNYSQIDFQGQSVMKMEMIFHQTLIHHLYNLTVDHMTGLHITTGLNSKWLTFFTVVIKCLLGTWTLFSSCGLPLLQLIMIHHLSQITWKCTMLLTQPPSVIFRGNLSP